MKDKRFKDKRFFDTSVLVYVLLTGDARSLRAEQVLNEGGQISVQVLNEFVAVARRKLKLPWDHIQKVLEAIRIVCPEPVPVTVQLHDAGLRIAQRFGYRIYDSLVIAAALQERCSVLYSEDMQDGQRIEHLTIRNPFIVN